MISASIRRYFNAILCASFLGCSEEEPEAPAFVPEPLETGVVAIRSGADTLTVQVEIAATAPQRARGLMEREQLDPGAGMWFEYPGDQPPDASFYMYNTLIPLDIAFTDSAGAIVSIHTMEPCAYPVSDLCRRYGPEEPYRSALEVNADYFEGAGVDVGDTIVRVR